MITVDNFNEVIASLKLKDLVDVLEDYDKDWVSLEVHTFNVGSYGTIKSCDYSEELEKEHEANGNLFIDKDNFISQMQDMDTVGYIKQHIIKQTTSRIEEVVDNEKDTFEWDSLVERTDYFNTIIEKCVSEIEYLIQFESEFITN